MNRRALIIGHTGQDGSYLKDLLKSKGYSVTGVASSGIYTDLSPLINKGDITDTAYCRHLVDTVQPDELYFLAALHQSSVEQSYSDLEFYNQTIRINALAFLNFLNSVHLSRPQCRVFYASSSHIFGSTPYEIQNEDTPVCPVSIYGISKVLGMQFCDLYRQKGVFCSAGIFYNHESPKRDGKFVSKKIVSAAVDIYLGKKDKLELGDLSAKIDWGYAPDYVHAAYLTLQGNEGRNYVISSGTLHTVQDFVNEVFSNLNLDWKKHVVENKQIILKKSVTVLRGDSSRLRRDTGWNNSVSFSEMINILVREQLNASSSEGDS